MYMKLFVAALIVAVAAPPIVRVMHRLGYSGWWAIVGVISPINIIALWFLAYADWPAVHREPSN